MPINYKNTSPYFNTPQRNFVVSYLDIINFRTIASDPSDTPIVVSPKFNQRPDLLANDLYGQPDLWWIFSMRNPNQLIDPIYDLVTDLEILVPTRQRLFSLLGI